MYTCIYMQLTPSHTTVNYLYHVTGSTYIKCTSTHYGQTDSQLIATSKVEKLQQYLSLLLI